MRIGEYFKKRRIALDFTTKKLAQLMSDNFEESLFWDFEAGDDNNIDLWSVPDFKRYCSLLEIKPTDFADIPISDMSELPLNLLVSTRRKEKNITIDDLSDRIGYYPIVVEAIENNDIDAAVCLDALKGIAKELDIPFRVLLEKI